MPERHDAILACDEWMEALRDLSLSCADSEPAETRDRLREIATLLVMAPEAAMLRGLRPIEPARLHALVEADALETAVLALLDEGSGFLLSRSGEGQSLATIALPGQTSEKSGSGATPALALIGALALALSIAAHGGSRSRWSTPAGASVALH